MGHALQNRQPAKLFPMQSKEPKTTWHHDWRGKLALSGIHIGLLASGGAIAWSLWNLAHVIR
jgi:hypothetical protein